MSTPISREDLLELGSIKSSSGVHNSPRNESTTAEVILDDAKPFNSAPTCNASDSSETIDPPVYPGAAEDDESIPVDNLQTLDFPNPSILNAYYNANVRIPEYAPHPWQIKTHEELVAAKPTAKHPYKFCLCAANGSGKDAYVIAPWVIWFALTKKRSLTIITSSSGVQLTAQTENYIRALAEKVNEKSGEDIFKIKQRYIKCRLSGSEIRLFATDEAGKAEGYHPLEPWAEMCIIVNEGKSVSEEIHGALKRCTGFNYWLEVSTPGEPFGFFYRAFCTWPHTRRVTAYDCPHISPDEIESDRLELGDHSALFRSMRLALFTSLGGNAVIPAELMEQLILNPPTIVVGADWPIRVGIDLAAGGDENSVHAFRGNKLIFEKHWRESDTTITADQVHEILNKNLKLGYKHEYISIDDGNVGHSITDMLVRRGWINIKRVLNQSSAAQKKRFGNKGAEMWARFARIVEERFIDVSKLSQRCRTQLANRYYKQQSTQGRIFLESKKEAKADGRPSPDRADSVVLAFSDLTLDDFLTDTKVVEPEKKQQLRTYEELQEWMANHQFNQDEQQQQHTNIHGSLNAFMNLQRETPLSKYGYRRRN